MSYVPRADSNQVPGGYGYQEKSFRQESTRSGHTYTHMPSVGEVEGKIRSQFAPGHLEKIKKVAPPIIAFLALLFFGIPLIKFAFTLLVIGGCAFVGYKLVMAVMESSFVKELQAERKTKVGVEHVFPSRQGWDDAPMDSSSYTYN